MTEHEDRMYRLERNKFWLHVAAVGAAVLVFLQFEWPARSVELESDTSEVIAMEGELLDSSQLHVVGRGAVEMRPVSVGIWNAGQSTFDIESIELRVYRASIPEVIREELIDEKSGLRVGILENRGEGWVEIAGMKSVRRPEACKLRPSQEVRETFHTYMPTGQSALVKYEVTVRTHANSSRTWIGFNCPTICYAEPSAPSIDGSLVPVEDQIAADGRD